MPKKLPQKAGYHHGDLRRALIDAATQLVAEGGEGAFTLREAASRVGVSHVAAYRHFEDKTALFAAVAEGGFRRMRAAQADAARGRPVGRERLEALAVAYVRFALEEPSTYRVMFGDRLDDGPVPGTEEAQAARARARFPTLDEAVEASFDLLVGEVVAAQEAGVLRPLPPRDLALALWTLTHGYVDLLQKRRIRGEEIAKIERHYLRILSISLDGMRP